MYRETKPAVLLPEPRETIAGWIYFPFYIVGLSFLLGLVFALAGVNLGKMSNLLHLNTLYGAINFLFLAIAFRRYLAKSARQLFRFPGRFFLGLFVGFAIYFLGTALMSTLTTLISPELENINDATLENMADFGYWEMFIYTVLLVPLAEETIFRGLVFNSLRPYNRIAAYVLTIAAFSAIHIIGYIGSYPFLTLVLCFLQYIPASFALVWAMEYSGSIWTSICIHTLANAFSMLMMLVTV